MRCLVISYFVMRHRSLLSAPRSAQHAERRAHLTSDRPRRPSAPRSVKALNEGRGCPPSCLSGQSLGTSGQVRSLGTGTPSPRRTVEGPAGRCGDGPAVQGRSAGVCSAISYAGHVGKGRANQGLASALGYLSLMNWLQCSNRCPPPVALLALLAQWRGNEPRVQSRAFRGAAWRPHPGGCRGQVEGGGEGTVGRVGLSAFQRITAYQWFIRREILPTAAGWTHLLLCLSPSRNQLGPPGPVRGLIGPDRAQLGQISPRPGDCVGAAAI